MTMKVRAWKNKFRFYLQKSNIFQPTAGFPRLFLKKKYCPMIHFSKIFYFRRETRKSHFYFKKFFQKKNKIVHLWAINIYIILTLYFILILYLILNHIKPMLRFCNKKRKILPILTYISIMIVTIVVIPVVMMVSLLYQTVLTIFVVGFSGWKTGVLKRGPFRFPYPLSFYRPIWTSQPYVMHYKMLSDIVIMTAPLDYLICMFIIKFNNRENLFLEQNETLQPLQQ